MHPAPDMKEIMRHKHTVKRTRADGTSKWHTYEFRGGPSLCVSTTKESVVSDVVTAIAKISPKIEALGHA